MAASALGEIDPTLTGAADALEPPSVLPWPPWCCGPRRARPVPTRPIPTRPIPTGDALDSVAAQPGDCRGRRLGPAADLVGSNGPHLVAALVATAVLSLLPAGLIAGAWSRWDTFSGLLSPLIAWRTSPRWYLVAMLLFSHRQSGLGLGFLAVLGAPMPDFPDHGSGPHLALALLSVFVSTALFGGPLRKEIGRRGYALPQLLCRHSPLVSSLILELVWGAWHVAPHVRDSYEPQSLPAGPESA